ncbi:chitin-binding type-2 domain-containing protein [Trichonephila clavipes]|nr:chitin-binding type-2 domain-containing protein [Trichonephila clavipes]
MALFLTVEGRAAGGLHRTKRQEETDFKCPKADGLFADPETCKKFYICAGHYPFSQNCPSSLYFDDIKKFCTRKTKQLACGPVETPETEAPPTPDPHLPNECDPSACVLPDCFCSSDGTRIPGGLEPSETPQMILLSFDGAVNSLNFDHYRKLLNKSRTNPNGCPIKGTFFVSHEYTSHFHLQKFFADGHEVAVHSIR